VEDGRSLPHEPWSGWRIWRIGGGRNNLLYRATGPAGDLAVKFVVDDGRDRAGHEYRALQVLRQAGLDVAPEPLLLARRLACRHRRQVRTLCGVGGKPHNLGEMRLEQELHDVLLGRWGCPVVLAVACSRVTRASGSLCGLGTLRPDLGQEAMERSRIQTAFERYPASIKILAPGRSSWQWPQPT
jgi:hypothetical protein